MILARCPACATTFRVRPEQLRARQGRVRCGHCQHAFNALETLVDEGTADEALALAPAQSEPALADSPSPLFVLEEKTEIEPFPPIEPSPDEPPAEPAQVDNLPAPEPFESPSFMLDEDLPPGPGESADPDFELPPPAEELPSDDPRIEPHGEVELADEWPAVAIDPAEPPPPDAFVLPGDEATEAQAASPASDGNDMEFELPAATEPEPESDTTSLHIEAGPPFAPPFRPEWPDASELELKAEPAAPLDFDSLLHRQDTGDSTAPPPVADTASPAAAALIAQPPGHDADTDAGRPTADTWQGSPAGDDTEPEPESEAPDEKPSGLLRQAAWAAGATLLALVLLAQGVLVFRNQIVQSSPHMRPFMESLCTTIGCDLPLPRDATLIAIESSDIQPDAGREAFFTLHVTLRNRAEFAQAHPHLEVTLTDARDKALVRRVLEPAQWLPADAPKDAFPAHREIAAQVAFEAPLVAAAGYRVWVFYP